LALGQIDFLSVLNDEQLPIDISTELTAAAGRPLDERVLEIGDAYKDVLLDDAEQIHGITLAHLARVRNDRRPGKYNHHSGAFGDLALEDDEDVGEDIYIGVPSPNKLVHVGKAYSKPASGLRYGHSSLCHYESSPAVAIVVLQYFCDT
jgi:hypothetical protein